MVAECVFVSEVGGVFLVLGVVAYWFEVAEVVGVGCGAGVDVVVDAGVAPPAVGCWVSCGVEGFALCEEVISERVHAASVGAHHVRPAALPVDVERAGGQDCSDGADLGGDNVCLCLR